MAIKFTRLLFYLLLYDFFYNKLLLDKKYVNFYMDFTYADREILHSTFIVNISNQFDMIYFGNLWRNI